MLPVEMMPFYKAHHQAIIDLSVAPDKRRYTDPKEAPRHYMDWEHYQLTTPDSLPLHWNTAKAKFGEEAMQKNGVVLWHIGLMAHRLTQAFASQDAQAIVRLSAEIGHYIGDAHVPLHNTENYNGQLSNQHGIHGLWETNLPELFSKQYNFYQGPAVYLPTPLKTIRSGMAHARSAVDSVLTIEAALTAKMQEDKFGLYTRNGKTVSGYSEKFSKAYHKKLNGMVERQLLTSIRTTANIWYTCWVNAGQPILPIKDFRFHTTTTKDSLVLKEHKKRH